MKKANLLLCLAVFVLILNFISCENELTGNGVELKDSLEPVEEVELVKGGENATVKVNLNKEDQAYFTIEFSNIQENNIIENGFNKGWCIDVWKPLNHNGGTYNGIKLHSTYRVEKWKSINYLLNIEEELRQNDQEISWREIQLAIWTLRKNPGFNLDEIPIENLPGAMQSNGIPKFSVEKVNEVLSIVEKEYKSFDYSQDEIKFAVIAAMPVDLQTFITVVQKK